MTTPVEARRFLHCCYCTADTAVTVKLLEEGLGLRVTMQTRAGRTSGSSFGIDGEIETVAAFVFDRRGPRTSPAIELQCWVDPPLVGEPYAAPNHVGIQAVGVAVPDLHAALARLATFGATTVGRAEGTEAVVGAHRAAVVRAPDDVLIDLVEDAALASTESRFHHLRVTCTDLSASLEWYQRLGFTVIDRSERAPMPGALFGLPDDGEADLAQLQLPDEGLRLVLQQWLAPASFGTSYDCPNHRGMYRAAICVDDTRDAFARLAALGYQAWGDPQLVRMSGTPVPDMWIAFLVDPDGIAIELVQRPRSAFR